MSKKHLACLVVFLLILGMAQVSMWMNSKMVRTQKLASAARLKMNTSEMALQREQQQFGALDASSKKLVEFLGLWKPHFDAIDSPQNAELRISLRIKEDNLVSLSQRYEVVPDKNNRSVSRIMRAHLTFDDSYARLLNWLGTMESDLPTMRIASAHLSKGTGANDLRMEVVLELPLLSK